MSLLALDTSTGACSAALLNEADGQILSYRYQIMPRGHAEALAPMVDEVMKSAGCKMAALKRIGVTIGPGTFTGVRIGLAFARALGAALGVPIIGVSTLRAIAANVSVQKSRVAAVMDARRGEVYLQLFSPAGEVLSKPQALGLEDAAASLADEKLTLIGSGTGLLGAGNPLWQISDASPFPDARKIALLAAREDAPSRPPGPLYLRAPDAKLSQKPPLARQNT